MRAALFAYAMSVTKHQRTIVDTIENSIMFHGWFEDFVTQTPEENQIAGLVSNLGLATDRFQLFEQAPRPLCWQNQCNIPDSRKDSNCPER